VNALNPIEAAVLDKLLAGDSPVLDCLRLQRARLHVTKRDLTGVGFFTELAHPADVRRLDVPRRAQFCDVLADVDGLQHGAGFVLFIDDGLLVMLEGYALANEPWPSRVEQFDLRYWHAERDFSNLR
jgi:hypothetical protein